MKILFRTVAGLVLLFLSVFPTAPAGAVMPRALLSYDCTAQSEIPVSSCEALVALYQSTNGPGWVHHEGWLENLAPCAWFGVVCRGETVYEISLPDNGLSGTVPAALGDLSVMSYLDLSGNALSGPLPFHLMDVPLSVFSFANTQLCVPDVGDFRGWLNKIQEGHGTGLFCPAEMLFPHQQFVGMVWLNDDPAGAPQYDCTRQTQIPVRSCEALVTLFRETKGPQWSLKRDWLQTSTPCSWAGIGCSGGDVTLIDLIELSGPIPPELGDLERLGFLNLGGNITGTIPPELGNLVHMQSLHIRSTRLSGPIPSQLGNLVELRELDLSGDLSGPIPPELGNLVHVINFWLSGNQLSGPIPPELGNLAAVEYLALADNQLSGPIPVQFANLAQLRILELNDNRLSGSIPPGLGNLKNLLGLDLAMNQLSGPLPVELSTLPELGGLEVSFNQLNGGISPAFGSLTKLRFLYLDHNLFSGAVPQAFANLQNMWSFYYQQTGLCDPTDEAFQEWKKRVPILRGTGVVCSP